MRCLAVRISAAHNDVKKLLPLGSLVAGIADYLLWYAQENEECKVPTDLFEEKPIGEGTGLTTIG